MDERERITERWWVAEELIRSRDVLRLCLQAGLDIPASTPWYIRELEQRFDELDRTLPKPKRIEFPAWVADDERVERKANALLREWSR